jgi:hypothetical protein
VVAYSATEPNPTGAQTGWRFDLDVDAWRHRACDLANRNLTTGEWTRYLGVLSYHRTCG